MLHVHVRAWFFFLLCLAQILLAYMLLFLGLWEDLTPMAVYAVTAIACVAIVHAIWEGVYNTRPTKVTSLLAVVHCWMPVLVACIMLYLLRNVFFDGTKTDVVAISAMTLLPLCGLSLVLITEEPFLE